MPLFKGQGCKSTPGKALDYITDKKKAEYVSSLNLDDNRNYAEQFRDTAKLYGKGTDFDERKYYSFKLSCDRADNVSAAAHHEYAEAVAKRFFPGHECVIATHTDTDTVHSHIIVNAVNFENGKKLNIRNNDYGKLKDLANEMGVSRGFSAIDFRKLAKDRVPSKERWVMLKGGTSWKEELREVICEAKEKTTNMADFEKHLNDYGVKLTRNTENTIAYLHPQKDKAIRGEKLGQDYTKGAILSELSKSADRQQSSTKRTTQTDSRSETMRGGERTSESRIGGIEREVRGISEGVHSLTSEGRAEQAERERELAQRVAAEHQRKQQEAERVERAKQRAAEKAEQQREQAEERESRDMYYHHGRSR
jgi:hypothetical protein